MAELEISPEVSSCPRMQGATDHHGNQYAGPPCPGCKVCNTLATFIGYLDREFPYKPCILPDHTHQMLVCIPCKELNRHRERNLHYYCPERGSLHETNYPDGPRG